MVGSFAWRWFAGGCAGAGCLHASLGPLLAGCLCWPSPTLIAVSVQPLPTFNNPCCTSSTLRTLLFLHLSIPLYPRVCVCTRLRVCVRVCAWCVCVCATHARTHAHTHIGDKQQYLFRKAPKDWSQTYLWRPDSSPVFPERRNACDSCPVQRWTPEYFCVSWHRHESCVSRSFERLPCCIRRSSSTGLARALSLARTPRCPRLLAASPPCALYSACDTVSVDIRGAVLASSLCPRDLQTHHDIPPFSFLSTRA
jgi:hypothetical protein